MEVYKIFKKSENFIKMLKPLNENSTCRVGVMFGVTQEPKCGYDDDENFYLILDHCPPITVGSCLKMKNVVTGEYENVGLISSIFYKPNYGYIFVFEDIHDEELEIEDEEESIDD